MGHLHPAEMCRLITTCWQQPYRRRWVGLQGRDMKATACNVIHTARRLRSSLSEGCSVDEALDSLCSLSICEQAGCMRCHIAPRALGAENSLCYV